MKTDAEISEELYRALKAMVKGYTALVQGGHHLNVTQYFNESPADAMIALQSHKERLERGPLKVTVLKARETSPIASDYMIKIIDGYHNPTF